MLFDELKPKIGLVQVANKICIEWEGTGSVTFPTVVNTFSGNKIEGCDLHLVCGLLNFNEPCKEKWIPIWDLS